MISWTHFKANLEIQMNGIKSDSIETIKLVFLDVSWNWFTLNKASFGIVTGTIKCDYFINCAGFWARSLGKKTQPVVKVPVQAVEHQYLHTKKVAGIDEHMPVIRDLDGRTYIRVKDGCYLAGGNCNCHWLIYNIPILIKFHWGFFGDSWYY